MRLVSDQSMSLLCGLGRMIFRPAFHIARCLPPASGAPQPKARSRRTKSRHLIGFGIRLSVQVNAVNHRQFVAVAEAYHDPTFQCASQVLPALLKCRALTPRSLLHGARLPKKRPFSINS